MSSIIPAAHECGSIAGLTARRLSQFAEDCIENSENISALAQRDPDTAGSIGSASRNSSPTRTPFQDVTDPDVRRLFYASIAQSETRQRNAINFVRPPHEGFEKSMSCRFMR
ncbi:hypothetical protein BSKO_14054 [Bryopsis sp. KO-2023]|nr:hypothetical protein BSKO_14054 [Bryopsis sp. KO-2023]